jgi:hypothetical protein
VEEAISEVVRLLGTLPSASLWTGTMSNAYRAYETEHQA